MLRGPSRKDSGDDYELVPLAGGVMSLRQIRNGETYHPGLGPMREARELHLAGTRLIERAARLDRKLVVWDVGLGAGANAIAALEAVPGGLEIHSFDITGEPLAFARREAAALGYPLGWVSAMTTLLAQTTWRSPDTRQQWYFHRGDFRETLSTPSVPAPDAVFWDPYSPRSSPEIWTLETFRHLFARLDSRRDCLLTSYSRSSAVRMTLLLAGFYVGAAEGVGEKTEMTVASNRAGLLTRPLGEDWLGRVKRSTNAAPLRPGRPAQQPGGEEDWRALRQHPQFR